MSFTGKHVLVTGSSGGIGTVVAQQFLQEGARVSLHFNSSDDALQALRAEYPAQTCAVQADLRDEAAVAALFGRCSAALGPLDVAVVNHGVFPARDVPLRDMAVEQFRATLETNLVSAFLVCKHFLRHLEERRQADPAFETGNVVLIGSTSGLFGERGHVDYSCSKSAMMYGLLKTLKNEIVQVVPKGRVNCVAPGWVLTKMAEDAITADPAVLQRACRTVAMGKVAQPADVAHSVLFLADDRRAGHVSGTVLECHGGMEGRLLNE
eukprot:EG_transcript_20246